MSQTHVISAAILLTVISAQGLFAAGSEDPVIIKRGDNPALPAIIYFTGDGGWNDFSQQIAENIHQKGYTIFSIDSKKYFWEKKTPQEVASLMMGLIQTYPNDFGQRKLVLMGYSFGASILPFVIDKLPQTEQAFIETVFCLSPSVYADFEVKFATMLNIGAADKNYPVIEEMKRLRQQSFYIYFGKDEDKQDIRSFKDSGLRLTLFPGSHRYNNDAAAVSVEMDHVIKRMKK